MYYKLVIDIVCIILVYSHVAYSSKTVLPRKLLDEEKQLEQRNIYDPTEVNWNLVKFNCKKVFSYEKRFANFFIRAAAHDSLTFYKGYGGSDGSLVLTADELIRPENRYDNFAYKISKHAISIAEKTGASVADVIVVCGAVAVDFLGGPDIFAIKTNTPFYVGRKDSTTPNPHKQLPKSNINTEDFAHFAESKGLTIQELVALMGSHVLIDDNACRNIDETICDPTYTDCDNVQMFSWSNKYYQDICNIETNIHTPSIKLSKYGISKEQKIKNELCKYTSKEYQRNILREEIRYIDDVGGDFVNVEILQTKDSQDEMEHWTYTTNDAYLGKACQNKLGNAQYNQDIMKHAKTFSNSSNEWNIEYSEAYKKMIDLQATWSIKYIID